MKDVNIYPYQSVQTGSVSQRLRSKQQTSILISKPIYLDLVEVKSCTLFVSCHHACSGGCCESPDFKSLKKVEL